MKTHNYELPRGKKVVYRKHEKDFEGKNDFSPRQNYHEWFPNKKTQIKWYTDPVFHSHNVNNKDNNLYRYKRVSPDEIYKFQPKVRRSSYIPYIVDKSEIYWLLGSFIDFPEIKVDFGGKCNEKKPYDCSTRELKEETHGVLVKPIHQALKDNRATVFKGTNKKGATTFFIMVNMTDHLDELDEIQKEINIASVYKPVVTDEDFGPLGFYNEKDIYKGVDRKTGKNIYTAFTLTDFISKFRLM